MTGFVKKQIKSRFKTIDGKKQYLIEDAIQYGSYLFVVDDRKVLNVANRYSNIGFMIVSACRENLSVQENNARSKQLEQDIRNKNLGYIRCLGGYKYNNDIEVEEVSFLVPYRKVMSLEDFVKLAQDLCKKYDQESVLLSHPDIEKGKYFYIDRTTKIDTVFSNLEFNSNSEYYTKIKNKKFSFKDKIYFGEYIYDSISEAQLDYSNQKILGELK